MPNKYSIKILRVGGIHILNINDSVEDGLIFVEGIGMYTIPRYRANILFQAPTGYFTCCNTDTIQGIINDLKGCGEIFECYPCNNPRDAYYRASSGRFA